jgi:Transposase
MWRPSSATDPARAQILLYESGVSTENLCGTAHGLSATLGTPGVSSEDRDLADEYLASRHEACHKDNRQGGASGSRRLSFRRGKTFGTVLVDLQRHQIVDLLPDRQKETAAAWMQTHPEITHVSRDRSSEYASAVAAGAPQAIQVADRCHVAKNLSESVQPLLARVLLEMKTASPEAEAAMEGRGDSLLPIEEWRPAQEESVKQIIATRRAERQKRYRASCSPSVSED